MGAKHEAIHHLQGPHVDVGHDVVGAERRVPSPGMTDHAAFLLTGKGDGHAQQQLMAIADHVASCSRTVGNVSELLVLPQTSCLRTKRPKLPLLQFG